MWSLCACVFLVGQAGDDWQKSEAAYLKNTRQVTQDFVRAGEGYFSPNASKIIFQAEEKGENPFYQMFVMDLKTGATRRVSPGAGKTTCATFIPRRTDHCVSFSRSRREETLRDRIQTREKKTPKAAAATFGTSIHSWRFESNSRPGHQMPTDSKGYDAEASARRRQQIVSSRAGTSSSHRGRRRQERPPPQCRAA